jgi:hypothetical protein
MKRRNWDADFYADIATGKSFIITEPGEITLDGSKQKALYGPYSPLYGTSYEDEHSFAERYRCRCGEFKSKIFEGEICPLCGTKVEYRDADVNVFGWISLGEHKIISPYYYHLLTSAIGKKPFPDIIFAKYKITTDGKRIKPRTEDLDEEPSSPYAGIGVEEFYNRYEEILEYFKTKKKNKEKRINILLKEKNNVFVSHIPIPSTMLRPQSITADSFYFQSIDKLINVTFRLSENLKGAMDVERDFILQRIQTKVNMMWDTYFEELNGKRGLIRGEMLGGSLNFTSRNVVAQHDSNIMFKLL